MMRYAVAADIGGTFTDVVALDRETGHMKISKVPSTPRDLTEGILAGLGEVVPNLAEVAFFVHGTTAGINSFLQRRGAKVALITTQGFRDVYEIGRGNRPEMYNLHYHKPKRLVRRRDVFEVAERVRHDGKIARPLELDALGPIMDQIEDGDYESIAICLLHAYANPDHELQIARALHDRFGDLPVSLSHNVAREWREYERTSTTVMDAYIAPGVEQYLVSLEKQLKDRGMEVPIHVMRSSGGLMTSDLAKSRAVHTMMSGPVGGVIGGAALIDQLEHSNLLCVDMGGTSFDMSLIVGAMPDVTVEAELEGFPLLAPMVQIHSIGAGGGSIAWLEGGGLRVGPMSAGADPGPACYGWGGTAPTVTDANLFLGRINPDNFLGGRMPLDLEAAQASLHRIAEHLDLSDTALAEGICRIASSNMAGGIRQITIERGIDPREFYLVAFGGGGPMHAVFIAEELDIPTVVVPYSPGTFSAWGMLHTDIRTDLVRSYYRRTEETGPAGLEQGFKALEREAAALLTAEHVSPEQRNFVRTADMRYAGQEHFLTVPMPAQIDAGTLANVPAAFHAAHDRRYGHSNPDETVEFVNIRLAAVGQLPKPPSSPLAPTRSGGPIPVDTRSVVFDKASFDAAIYARGNLQAGDTLSGPAIIEEESCTTVVPPGCGIWVDDYGNLLIKLGEG